MEQKSNLNNYLSAEQKFNLNSFYDKYKHIENQPFLALFGVDSLVLNNAFILYLKNMLPPDYIIIENTDDFSLGLLEKKKYGHYLISYYNTTNFKKHISDLQFHRDFIIQYSLKIFIVGNIDFIQSIIKEAFDFYSIANFTGFFNDKFKNIETNFFDLNKKSKYEIEFYTAIKELNNYKKQSKVIPYVLLIKIIEAIKKAYKICKYDYALNLSKEGLDIVNDLNIMDYKSILLNEIGKIYLKRNELDKALDYFNDALNISKKIDKLNAQAIQIGNIGLVYQKKNNIDKALQIHLKSLQIHKKTGNFEGEAIQLSNIGNIYKNKNDCEKALKYYNEALEIDKKIGNLEGKAIQFFNIADVYQNKNEFDKALKYYNQALEINKETYNLNRSAEIYCNIGIIYQNKGDFDLALKYQEHAHKIIEKN